MHTTPYVRLEISPVLSTGQPVVIDLTQVAFMDSAGYGMLVGLAKVAADNNALMSVAVKSPGIVLTGLRVLQVDHVLHVAMNVEDAIKLVRS
jgi:anti-anti-sigma factor